MQEDADDIFIRARDDLVNAVSVLDEDISTYVEEYIFAKSNLDANGFDLNPTWKEEVCDLLIKEKNLSDYTEGGVPFTPYSKPLEFRRYTKRRKFQLKLLLLV